MNDNGDHCSWGHRWGRKLSPIKLIKLIIYFISGYCGRIQRPSELFRSSLANSILL